MNLGQLRSWVRAQTLVTVSELSDADLNSRLQQALLDVAARNAWPWAETSDTISLVDGTPTYALPADTMWVKELIHDGEGFGTRLARTTLEAVKAEFGDVVGDSDLPDRYYQSGLQVTFVPTPDAAKTVNVIYYATPDLTAFDTDSEEPPFHSAFHLALAEWASSQVWAAYENEQKADYYFGRYYDTIGRMAAFYDSHLPPEPVVVGGGVRWQTLSRHFDGYLGL